MQPRNTVPLQPPKPQKKSSTVLQKVARKILAPIRSTPFPASPTHSSSTSSGLRTLPTPQTPQARFVETSSALRSKPPAVSPLKNQHNRQYHDPTFTYNHGGVFVFPTPLAPPSPEQAPESPTTSSIHRRRGAIVELPNEWYAKAEGYNALGLVRTRDRMDAERIRRVKSFDAPLSHPSGTVRSVGLSLLGCVRRGKSAQAALGVSAPPRSTPALAEEEREQEQERPVLDWRNSTGLSDEVAITFDFEDELDALFDEV